MQTTTIEACYRLIGELMLYPEMRDAPTISRLLPQVEVAEPAVRGPLTRFVSDLEDISCEHYVQTLEMSSDCPLYLGCYLFEEPSTCRTLATSKRNQYMIELVNLYGHVGFSLGGELPDFLPVVAEFLAISVRFPERDRIGLRRKLISDYVLPAVRPMLEALRRAETPYAQPVEALEHMLRYELEQMADDPVTPVREEVTP